MDQRPRFVLEPGDAARFRKWTLGVVLLFVLTALYSTVHAFYSRKFHGNTGKAVWIWQNRPFVTSHDIDRRSGTPAAFFAVRAFDVPAARDFVHIKVSADPQYQLWFNGVEVGEGAGGSSLEVYDVSDLAHTGPNLIVASLRSANGVGGFLASVDFSRTRENVVVTDGSWRIYHHWREGLTAGNLKGLAWSGPRILGEPPVGRWNYLTEVPGQRTHEVATVVYPAGSTRFATVLPQIRDISGVVVAISLPVPATAYDFGLIRGHGQVESKAAGPRLVRVRYANDPSEFGGEGTIVPFVLAEGENVVADPNIRTFRYMVIYGDESAGARVIQVQ